MRDNHTTMKGSEHWCSFIKHCIERVGNTKWWDNFSLVRFVYLRVATNLAKAQCVLKWCEFKTLCCLPWFQKSIIKRKNPCGGRGGVCVWAAVRRPSAVPWEVLTSSLKQFCCWSLAACFHLWVCPTVQRWLQSTSDSLLVKVTHWCWLKCHCC